MGYTLTNAERETTIRWDADEKRATVFTADPVYIRKLDRLSEEYPEVYSKTWTDGTGAKYECPARMIRFGKPPSEARREASRRNAQNLAGKRVNLRISEMTTDGDE